MQNYRECMTAAYNDLLTSQSAAIDAQRKVTVNRAAYRKAVMDSVSASTHSKYPPEERILMAVERITPLLVRASQYEYTLVPLHKYTDATEKMVRTRMMVKGHLPFHYNTVVADAMVDEIAKEAANHGSERRSFYYNLYPKTWIESINGPEMPESCLPGSSSMLIMLDKAKQETHPYVMIYMAVWHKQAVQPRDIETILDVLLGSFDTKYPDDLKKATRPDTKPAAIEVTGDMILQPSTVGDKLDDDTYIILDGVEGELFQMSGSKDQKDADFWSEFYSKAKAVHVMVPPGIEDVLGPEVLGKDTAMKVLSNPIVVDTNDGKIFVMDKPGKLNSSQYPITVEHLEDNRYLLKMWKLKEPMQKAKILISEYLGYTNKLTSDSMPYATKKEIKAFWKDLEGDLKKFIEPGPCMSTIQQSVEWAIGAHLKREMEFEDIKFRLVFGLRKDSIQFDTIWNVEARPDPESVAGDYEIMLVFSLKNGDATYSIYEPTLKGDGESAR